MILLKISGDNGVKIMFEALSCFDDRFIFHEHYKKSKPGYDNMKRRHFYIRAYWLAWAGRRSIVLSTIYVSVMTFNLRKAKKIAFLTHTIFKTDTLL